ncbi:autotransporter outer membrane beta-barrel domain-containing protein [Citrobacter koseri]|uniref:autotransporter outer membrane beta-barrel domain-containing protein n=1 Tax=Citrobacter koseri TaxID=545 RepID=UPI0023AEFF64|nr:autotransporter outer membrane beta-barrel domain-containing protein [Citrobacter koseri]
MKTNVYETRITLSIHLLAVGVMFSFSSIAGTLVGGSQTVNPGDPTEAWNLRDGASLQVNPGSTTNSIILHGDSVLSMNGADISTSGDRSYGIAVFNSQATVSNSTITNTGAGGFGINASTDNSSTASSSIVTVTDTYISAERGVNTTTGAEIYLSGTEVNGVSNGGSGTYDGGIAATMTGGTIWVTDGSSLNGEQNGALLKTDIPASDGTETSPVLIIDNSSISSNTGSAIVVDTVDLAPGEGPITGHADIVVTNNSSVIAGNGVLLEVTSGAQASFTVDHSILSGDVVVDEESAADVTLQNSALLTGQLKNVDNLTVTSDARWNMTDDAYVSHISLDNGNVTISDGSGFNTLHMDTLDGSGTFYMNTDVASGQGDFIDVSGEANGQHYLAITNTGTDPKGDDTSLQVVHTEGGDAEFAVVGGVVDLGTYQYELEQQGTDWYLTQQQDGGGGVITPSASSVIGLFNAAPTIWYGELSTLRTRMGELRHNTGEDGTWVRTYSNRFDLNAAGNLSYRQDQYGIVVGADTALPTNESKWLIGIMVGYSRSDLDIRAGTSGDVNSYYAGIYNTYLAPSGFYIDGLLKVNRFENKSDVMMSDGTRTKGDYDNNGIGGVLEIGKTFTLKEGWFIEPFTQFSALWVEGDDYKLSNGMTASSNHANSQLLKAGATFGKNFESTSGDVSQLYLRLAGAHEFEEGNDVLVNNDSFTNDISGSRFEVGTGGSLTISPRFQMHADIEYSKGKNMEQPFGVSVGIRYIW